MSKVNEAEQLIKHFRLDVINFHLISRLFYKNGDMAPGSVVEHSTADRNVPGTTPSAPYIVGQISFIILVY